MTVINGISNIFKNNCNYKTINGLSDIKMRNNINGIKLIDIIYYRFMYSAKDTTKQGIVSKINLMNNNFFTRQAFSRSSARK